MADTVAQSLDRGIPKASKNVFGELAVIAENLAARLQGKPAPSIARARQQIIDNQNIASQQVRDFVSMQTVLKDLPREQSAGVIQSLQQSNPKLAEMLAPFAAAPEAATKAMMDASIISKMTSNFNIMRSAPGGLKALGFQESSGRFVVDATSLPLLMEQASQALGAPTLMLGRRN